MPHFRHDRPQMMGETLSSKTWARDECGGWRCSYMTCCPCRGKVADAAPCARSYRAWGWPTSRNLSSPLGSTPHGGRETQSQKRWYGLIHEDASSREAVSGTAVRRVAHCTSNPGIHDGPLACWDLRLASCVWAAGGRGDGCQVPPHTRGSEPQPLPLTGSHSGWRTPPTIRISYGTEH